MHPSLYFNYSPQLGDYAGPLNTYVVSLTLRYNYAHLSYSSLCHCVSYQPSLASREKLLLRIRPNFSLNSFHCNTAPLGFAVSVQLAGIRELLTQSELTCQGYRVCLIFSLTPSLQRHSIHNVLLLYLLGGNRLRGGLLKLFSI